MTIATETMEPRHLDQEQMLLRARLSRLRRRLKLQMALESALDAVATFVAATAALALIDWLFRLGLTARQLLLSLTILGVLPFLVIRTIRRWRAARLDDLSLAMMLDRFRPGTGTRIVEVLQLPDLLAEPVDAVSPAMIRLAVSQASDALANSDWATLWNRGRTAARSATLLGVLAVPVLFSGLAPQATRLLGARWLLGSSERWPQRTYLSVVGLGDRNRLLAPRDEPLTLEVRSDLPDVEPIGRGWSVRGRGEPLILRSRPTSPTVPESVRVREKSSNGTVRDALMVATGPAMFRHEIPPASAATTIVLTGGDDWLEPLTVERADRPGLRSAMFRVHEPGTPPGQFRAVDENLQHPAFLPDTEIELTLTGSEALSDARLVMHPGQTPKLVRRGDGVFSTLWTLREAVTLEVQLTSTATGLTSKPTFLSVGLVRDREPRVTLRAIGVGAHVTPSATIPLSVAATDDLGLVAVRLQLSQTSTAGDASASKTSSKTIPFPLATEGGGPILDHQNRHDVELQAAPPPIGAILRYVAEAEDRCARGAQVGRSQALQMQVVPPDELFYEILTRQRNERAKFLAIVEGADGRTKSLVGSPAREAYAAAARAIHTESRQAEMIAGRIADTLQEMKLNRVGSPKSHRLLQEGVIDPIRSLNAGPITDLRAALLSLAGSGPKTGADPESARRLHADVVARLKTILEQMSQWESFVDVVNQVAEVIKMQQGVLQATEKARESRTQEVFDEKP